VRYEWLSQYQWQDLDEVQMHATQWMWMYNHERPNMALGGITPKQRLAMTAVFCFSVLSYLGCYLMAIASKLFHVDDVNVALVDADQLVGLKFVHYT
jgi:hypothetical protein